MRVGLTFAAARLPCSQLNICLLKAFAAKRTLLMQNPAAYLQKGLAG